MEGCRHRLARLASGRRTRAQSLSPRPRALSARRQEEIALEINACTASSGFQLLLVRSCDDEKPSEHHKDNMSKRRLQMLVSKRNRMLKYMRREQRGAYLKVIEGLRIRPNKNFDPTIKPQKQKWAGSKKKHGRGKGRPREARVYGHAKTAKGRTRLVQHGHRQRKLQRERAAAAAEAKAEASGTA